MTKEQAYKAAHNVIYLAGCAVNETVPNLTKTEDTESVYSYAGRHKLTAAVAMAMESAGKKDKMSGLAILNALKKKILFEKAYTQVKYELEKAGIWFLPLKGMILKEFYPKPGMREMGDYDILFDVDRADDVKAIMEGLGYETGSFGSSHHDCYEKWPFLRFEMHRELFSPGHDVKLYEYYRDVYNRLLGEGYEKHFSPEDFYIYIIAHEYKHYSTNGTGLRSLLDTYVYLQKVKLDMDYVTAVTEKLGMAMFEAANRSLAMHLFTGKKLTASDREMLKYILSSGVYGTLKHRVENKIKKSGGKKMRYMLNRFFVPISKKNKRYAEVSGFYPFFYKHKYLLPILPFYRTFRAIRNGKFKAELLAVRKAKN